MPIMMNDNTSNTISAGDVMIYLNTKNVRQGLDILRKENA